MSPQKKALCLIIICLLSLAGCGSPDEKKQAFFDKGKTLYKEKDFVRARLELKNALQIDPKFADAYLLLGQVEQDDGNFKKSYGYLLKAVNLAPDNIDARVVLGRLLVGGRGFDQAMEQAEEILKRDPDNMDGAMMKAAVYMSRKAHNEAHDILVDLKESGVTLPDIYLMLSSIAEVKSDSETAYALIHEGLEKNPDAIPLLLTMAQMEAGRDNKSEVVKLLKRTISLQPDNDGFRMNLAGFYLNGHRETDAVAVMDDILNRSADEASEDKSGIVAGFWLKNNRPNQAVQVLEQAIAKTPGRFDFRKQLSDIFIAQNDIDKAKQILETGLSHHEAKDDPGRIILQTALAQIFFREGNRDEAKVRIDEVLANDPKNVTAHLIKGNLLLAEGDAEKAVAAFRVVVSDHPELAEGHIGLARAHAMAKAYDLAVDVLKSALKNIPESEALIQSLAEMHLLAGDDGAARTLIEKDLKRRLDASPGDPKVKATMDGFLTLLVRYYFSKGAPDAAEALCRDYPDNAACWNAMGNLYEQSKQYDAAMAAYHHIWERNPKAWDAANNMAFLLIRKDPIPANLDRAMALAEKALTLNPGSPFILDTIGWIHYHKGEYSTAKEKVTMAVEKLDKHPVVAYHMGMILHQMGDEDAAREWFSKTADTPGVFDEKSAAKKMLGE